MKNNRKLMKKAIVAASLTAGVIGFNSMFNEAQASNHRHRIISSTLSRYQW
jgi:hypothetical protein